jgi:PAT family beta-lactamase induction signal transducer AmpG
MSLPAGQPGALRSLFDRRLLAVFGLGLASGYPWVVFGSAMSAWLADLGVSRSAIGFIGIVGGAYAINFLWGPLVDRLRLPLFARLGQRRGWIIALQFVLLALTLKMSTINPSLQPILTGALLLSLSITAASQDLAIDAYRVELIARDEQSVISHGAAMATAGWWGGYAGLGALPFLLVGQMPGGWADAYLLMAAIWLVLMLVTLSVGQPRAARPQAMAKAVGSLAQRFVQVVVEPFAEFFRRNGWQLALAVIAFVLLFKIGEAFLGRMSIVFYKEVGFSDADIGAYSKLTTGVATVVFALLGSLVNARFGVIKGLLVGGIAMAATNLLFAVMAHIGPVKWFFLLTVIVDGYTAALGTVAFVTFITFLTSHTFSATQYALLASLGSLGRTTLASSSGVLVDWMDGNWTLFFVLTALAVLPSLCLLAWLAPRLRQRYPDAFPSKQQAER